MAVFWFSSPTLFMITLGFAGLLGNLIYHLRERISPQLIALCALVLGMVILPPLSLPILLQRTLWGAGLIVILAYAVRPSTLPANLHTRRFAMRYTAVAMVLSAIWNILSGPSFPAMVLAAFACLAALMAWFDS
ncbi:MAG: hypothetical protein PVI99_03065 [Anaerolineales bacterium]|jgi:hypothetical protein